MSAHQATPGVIPAPLGSDERYDQLCTAIDVAQTRIAALLDPNSIENRFARLQAVAHAVYLSLMVKGHYMSFDQYRVLVRKLRRGEI